MKIKRSTNAKKETLFVVGAIMLALFVFAYVFWSIHFLADKASTAFGPADTAGEQEIHFDFPKYNEVTADVLPKSQ